MLVLRRKPGEAVITGATDEAHTVIVHVLDIEGGRVLLGFDADPAIKIVRSELFRPKLKDTA